MPALNALIRTAVTTWTGAQSVPSGSHGGANMGWAPHILAGSKLNEGGTLCFRRKPISLEGGQGKWAFVNGFGKGLTNPQRGMKRDKETGITTSLAE